MKLGIEETVFRQLLRTLVRPKRIPYLDVVERPPRSKVSEADWTTKLNSYRRGIYRVLETTWHFVDDVNGDRSGPLTVSSGLFWPRKIGPLRLGGELGSALHRVKGELETPTIEYEVPVGLLVSVNPKDPIINCRVLSASATGESGLLDFVREHEPALAASALRSAFERRFGREIFDQSAPSVRVTEPEFEIAPGGSHPVSLAISHPRDIRRQLVAVVALLATADHDPRTNALSDLIEIHIDPRAAPEKEPPRIRQPVPLPRRRQRVVILPGGGYQVIIDDK